MAQFDEVFRVGADRRELEQIGTLSATELDQLPFGAIRLDTDGTILSFNSVESQLTGRKPEHVIGKNFFTTVAPCTNVQSFAGEFRRGVAAGELHVVFPYRFDFKMKPRDVTVSLLYSKTTRTAWVFVRDL